MAHGRDDYQCGSKDACNLSPVLFDIFSKGFQDVEKQREWSAQWESWGMPERHNMGLEQWKAALKKIGITHGEEKPEYMSPVKYRKKIVVCIKKLLEIINEKIVSGNVVSRGEPSRSGVVSRSRSGVVTSGNLTSRSGSTSGAEVSRIATQPSNVVTSSGSVGRQFGESLGVGLAVGLAVGVGQGVGVVLTETVQHYFSPSPPPTPSPSPLPRPPPSSSPLPRPPFSSSPKHRKYPCLLQYREGTWHKNTNAGRCKSCGAPMKRFPGYFMCQRGLGLERHVPWRPRDLIS